MRILDLCAGIGGFSYAAHKIGWETVAFCEIEEARHDVLKKNFPGVPIYDDIFTFPSESFRGRADIITAGFPCQPFSHAGLRRGTSDERYIFPQILKIVRDVAPRYCVFENVSGLTSMANEVRDVKVGSRKYPGQPDIDDYEAVFTRQETMLLNVICDEIERAGCAVQPVVIPAAAREADHERYRIWIVGRRNSSDASGELARRSRSGLTGIVGEAQRGSDSRGQTAISDAIARPDSDASNLDHERHLGRSESGEDRRERQVREGCGNDRSFGESAIGDRERNFANWFEAATELCGVVHEIPAQLDAADLATIRKAIEFFGREEVERTLGFDCREIENRMYAAERISALGNAIVPDIAEEIFRAIDECENGETP